MVNVFTANKDGGKELAARRGWKENGMRSYDIVPDENKRPTTKIMVSGFEVLTLDINGGWEITKVIFDDEVPAQDIDELVVTIKKRGNNEQAD